MEPEFSSVFDIMGRLAITPNQEHIDMAHRLGQALHQWLGLPQALTWQLDHSMTEASFNQTMMLAVSAGFIGVDSLAGDPNILEIAYQHQIHIDFVPNANIPDSTARLIVNGNQVFEFATHAANDTFAITAMNHIPVTITPGSPCLLVTVRQQPHLNHADFIHISPVIDFDHTNGMVLNPKLMTTDLIQQVTTTPGVLTVIPFR